MSAIAALDPDALPQRRRGQQRGMIGLHYLNRPHAFNGYGRSAGLSQIAELAEIETLSC
jgi:hypothetical protein